MLQALKAKITNRWDRRAIVSGALQLPKLPFEILFKILDELAGEGTPEAISALVAVGATCRALASHRRDLLFRSTEVHWHLLSATDRHRAHRKKTPTRFLTLTRCYPSVLKVIRSLSLCFEQRDGSGRNSVKTKQDREWIDVLSSRYPGLQTFQLDFPRWNALSLGLQEAILWALLQAVHLETLVVDIPECPPQILQYCPSSLRHFAYLSKLPAEGKLPIDFPAKNRPTLESFTYAGICRALLEEHASFPSLLDHKSLKHIEMWSLEGLAVFPLYSSFAQQSSSTLQCIHLFSPGFVYQDFESPPPALNLGSLLVLRLLEVGINIWQIAEGMRWLTDSVSTTSVRDLAIVVNIQQTECWAHSRPPAYVERLHQDCERTWLRAGLDHVNASYWSGLQNANVFAFSEIVTSFGYRAKAKLHHPMLPQVGVNTSSLGLGQRRAYRSLVQEVCVCSSM
jgi:hypothetical protein